MHHDRRLPVVLVALSLSGLGAACSDHAGPSAAPVSGPDLEFRSAGSTQTDEPDDGAMRDSLPVATSPSDSIELDADDMAGLLWMREEEQLAHDVYIALGNEWGLRIFSRIAASERRHVSGVVRLLDQFGIDDPMADRPSGTFTLPEMQQLFDELVGDGRRSLVDALAVGALIEEIDIVDLRARPTEVDDLQRLYTRLEAGSQQHLRAFVGQLDARGVGYDPTRLDATTYVEIVSDG